MVQRMAGEIVQRLAMEIGTKYGNGKWNFKMHSFGNGNWYKVWQWKMEL
jgi:hypothetical protein